MNSKVYESLVKLCTDICKRNGKKKLLWFGDKEKALAYEPKADEMIITVHRWFKNKSCPGDWLYGRLGDLAAKVTANLGGNKADGKKSDDKKADDKKTDNKKADDKVLYCVQTAAFSAKENAEKMIAKLKAAGFDTRMVKADGLYKIQVGAYGVKANADAMLAKMKSAGFDAFITKQGGKAHV